MQESSLEFALSRVKCWSLAWCNDRVLCGDSLPLFGRLLFCFQMVLKALQVRDRTGSDRLEQSCAVLCGLRAGESRVVAALVDLKHSQVRFCLELLEMGTGNSVCDRTGKLPPSESVQHRDPFRNSRNSRSSRSFD
jgi:hypothetical protein